MAASAFVRSIATVSATDEAHQTGQPEVTHESATTIAAVDCRSKYTLHGKIRMIDHNAGIMGVQTEERVLTLQDVPEATKNWKEGDPVVVEFGGTEWRSGGDGATGDNKPPPSGCGEDTRLSPRN